jgi:squalene-hopene/tetraprenyl-beta-curcumene cyclase
MDRKKLVSWRNFFLLLTALFTGPKRCTFARCASWRSRKAEKWMLERLEMTDGLGAIYPAMLNAIIALRCLGYSEDDPQVIRARDEFEKLGIEEPANAPRCPSRPSACSPACRRSGIRRRPSCAGRSRRAAQRSAHDQGRRLDAGQGSPPQGRLGREGSANTEPGGWYFEFNNEFYPDTDDTAQVLLALNKVDNPRERYQHEVAQRAIDWEFAMQCKNGGWGSFDKDNTKMIFQYIPFADHNAMLDPPTVDITGRILEMLATYGYTATTSASRRPSSSSSASRSRTEAGLAAGA